MSDDGIDQLLECLDEAPPTPAPTPKLAPALPAHLESLSKGEPAPLTHGCPIDCLQRIYSSLSCSSKSPHPPAVLPLHCCTPLPRTRSNPRQPALSWLFVLCTRPDIRSHARTDPKSKAPSFADRSRSPAGCLFAQSHGAACENCFVEQRTQSDSHKPVRRQRCG
jgi:hypothetical protein